MQSVPSVRNKFAYNLTIQDTLELELTLLVESKTSQVLSPDRLRLSDLVSRYRCGGVEIAHLWVEHGGQRSSRVYWRRG